MKIAWHSPMPLCSRMDRLTRALHIAGICPHLSSLAPNSLVSDWWTVRTGDMYFVSLQCLTRTALQRIWNFLKQSNPKHLKTTWRNPQSRKVMFFSIKDIPAPSTFGTIQCKGLLAKCSALPLSQSDPPPTRRCLAIVQRKVLAAEEQADWTSQDEHRKLDSHAKKWKNRTTCISYILYTKIISHNHMTTIHNKCWKTL